MARNLVPRGAMSDVADVKMPGQEDVRAGIRKPSHRHSRTANKMLVSVGVGKVEGMMRHHDLDRAVSRRCQPCRRFRDLRLVQATTAVERKVARAVQPHRDEPVAFKYWLKVRLDVPLISAKGIE